MDFEASIQTSQIKAIKAAIPHLEPDNAMKMWIIVKLMEIKNIIDYYKNSERRDNMNIDLDQLLKSEVFSSLDDSKKTMLEEFVKKLTGKSQLELMPIFMEYFEKLSKSGGFSDEQRSSVLGAIKNNLSDADQKKFEMVETMLKGKFL